MASFDALAEAYVRLRAKDDGTLGRDVQSIVGRVATDAAALFAGKKLLDVGIAGLDELKQAQVVTAQTSVQLRATGEAAGISAQHIQDLGQQMLDLAGFDDEAARSAANVLLQFNQIKGTAAFDRVLKDAADLSVTIASTTGGVADLAGATRILGLALQAPEQATRLLRSANITLTQSQKDQLTAAEATNDVGKETDIILGIVESRVKGAAQQFGETLPGSLQRSQEELKNAKAELVGGFAPAVQFGADSVTFLSKEVEAMPAGLQAAVGGVVFLGGGLASLVRPISDVVTLLNGVRAARIAKAAATAADVAADEASAAAALTDASAQGTDAAATEAAAVAHEASGAALASSLGPIGLVAAGVGILAVALAAGGHAEHNAAVDAADFTQALKEQGAQADQDVDKVAAHALAQDSGARAAANAGISYRALFDAIRNGTDDFSTLREEVESLGAKEGLAGQGTTDFSRQLIAAADAGKLTKGQVIELLSTMEGLHNKFVDQKTAADAEAAALGQTGTAADGTATSMDGLTSSTDDATGATNAQTQALAAQNQQRQTQLTSAKNLFDAQQAMTAAEHGVATAARGVTDAERGVDDANRRLEDSYRSVADAQKKVQDAQEALNKAMAGATAEELGKANLDLSDAQLQAADATQAVADAQHKLDRDTRLGRTRALPKDQEDLTKAQNALERSIYGVTDAQDALNKTQQKGSDQDPAVIQARKDIDSANRNLTDSEKGVRDAVQGVADAQQRVVDAKDRVNDAYVTEAGAASGLKDAQANLYGSSESVNTSLRNQIAALQGVDAQLEPGSPARQHLDDYIAHLFVLAGIFQTSPTFDQAIIIQPVPGGPVQQRAAGGPLDPNVPTWVGENEPELAFHNFIYPSGKKRSGNGGSAKGGDSYYYDYTINYPAPEPASGTIRREFARQSVLNGG